MQFLRSLALCLIFIAALIATAVALARLDPFGEVPGVQEKWAYWRAHKDEFDTVFIGTSRTYRGIMPSVFDELTAAAGVPTRTFNFGIDGMFPPEDGYVAEQLLANPPRNLRWVITEIGGFSKDLNERQLDNVRSVYWHDWPRTSLVIRAVLGSPEKNKWKKWFRIEKREQSRASLAAQHLRLFLSKSLNLARGSDVLDRLFFERAPNSSVVLGPRQDGFAPMPGSGLRGPALAEYQKDYAERLRHPTDASPLDRFAEKNLARTVSRVRYLGARPLVLVAPTTLRRREHPSPALGVPVIDLDDPQANAELFAPEVRSDFSHVNAKGADLFTRRVAEKFIALVRTPSDNHR